MLSAVGKADVPGGPHTLTQEVHLWQVLQHCEDVRHIANGDPSETDERYLQKKASTSYTLMRASLPSAGEEAGDASNVQPVEVAEEHFAEVQVNHWLQRLHSCRALQRQQRSVVMHCHLALATI